MKKNEIASINASTLQKISLGKAVLFKDKYFGFYEAKLNNWTSKLLFNCADDPRCHDLLYVNKFEPNSMNLAYVLAKQSDYFIDVGAHTGMYSLGVADANANLKIFSFEPNPLAFARLVMHININDLTKKIAPFQFAIGKIFGETAKVHWFSSKGFGWISSGTKTVIEKNNIDQYGAVSFVINLDHIKINPEERCLIKIDVEGFETEVFLGATNLLKSKPNIILETFSNENVLKIKKLISSDYRFFKIDEKSNKLNEVANLEPASITDESFNIFLTCDADLLIPILLENNFIINELN
jgi:FkbM family methyltransferase